MGMHSAGPFDGSYKGGLVTGAGAESTERRQTGERPGEHRGERHGERLGERVGERVAERVAERAGERALPRRAACTRGCGSGRRAVHRRELRHHLRRADLPGVAEARRLLRDQLRHWGADCMADTAELLASELVTNALVHTDREAVLTATLTEGSRRRLRVEVHDFTSRRPRPRKASDRACSGRGLMLVEALADTWGIRPEGAGKTVWFELAGEGTA